MDRNYEHEALYQAAWTSLWVVADELLPARTLRVESPMERAERSFRADEVSDGFTGQILADLSDALDDAAHDQPKVRKAGVQWAAQVLRGTNT